MSDECKGCSWLEVKKDEWSKLIEKKDLKTIEKIRNF
jgi:hypothetical protein